MKVFDRAAAGFRKEKRQKGMNCTTECAAKQREREAERGAHVLEIGLANRGRVVRECLGDSHSKPSLDIELHVRLILL